MTLEGTWQAVVAELGGQHIDEEFLSVITLVINGEECEMTIGGIANKGTLKFVPHVVPMAFDFTSNEGENKGKVFKAIYKISGGFLIVCYNTASSERPTSFISTPENQFYLVRYKRTT